MVTQSAILDPATGTWTVAPAPPDSLGLFNFGYSLAPLGDGRAVVMAGGGSGCATVSPAYVYAPSTSTWSTAPAAWSAATSGSAQLLADGTTLIQSGSNLFKVDLATLAPTKVGTVPVGTGGLALPMTDGRALFVAGTSTSTGKATRIDAFDATAGAWKTLGNFLAPSRGPVAQAGEFIVGIGGYDGAPVYSGEAFSLTSGTSASLGSPPAVTTGSTATGLLDGTVLIAGGTTGGATTNRAYRIAIATPGQPCTVDGFCSTQHCGAEGFCCDTPCAGACMSCLAANKASGADGTCGPVKAGGADPAKTCSDKGATSCQTTGVCDGAGACALYAAGTACGGTTCAGGIVTGQTCNGAGSCEPGSKPCAPYVCSATACKTTCAGEADCADGSYCTTSGSCTLKVKTGLPCGASKECTSGYCADGFCCNTPCTGQCEACGQTGNEGSCFPVTGVPAKGHKACDGDPATCGGQCNGTNTASCTYAPSTKSCGSVCTGGNENDSTCDGLGSCVASTKPKACAPYICGDKACLTTCTKNEDCATSYKCSSGTCIPAGGATCSADLTSSTGADGTVTDCGLYKCEGADGRCKQICNSSDDCRAGNVCDTASKTYPFDEPRPVDRAAIYPRSSVRRRNTLASRSC